MNHDTEPAPARLIHRVADERQFLAGLFFLLLGVGTLLEMPREIGTAANMGPGYIPMLLGICLTLLGGGAMFAGLRASTRVSLGPIPFRTGILVLCGIWMFAALITRAGLAVSLLALLLLSCAERLWRNPIEIAVTYVVLLAMTWLIFIRIIELPISLL